MWEHVCHGTHVYVRGSVWEFFLSFYHVDSKDGILVLSLGSKYPDLLSYLWPNMYTYFYKVYSKILHEEENQGNPPNPPHLLLKSTWMEWSITRSAGQTGFIFSGFPPSFFTASRIAAKSTTAGTPLREERSKQKTAVSVCDWIWQVLPMLILTSNHLIRGASNGWLRKV